VLVGWDVGPVCTTFLSIMDTLPEEVSDILRGGFLRNEAQMALWVGDSGERDETPSWMASRLASALGRGGGVRRAAMRIAVSSPEILELLWGGTEMVGFWGSLGAYQMPLPAFASLDLSFVHERVVGPVKLLITNQTRLDLYVRQERERTVTVPREPGAGCIKAQGCKAAACTLAYTHDSDASTLLSRQRRVGTHMNRGTDMVGLLTPREWITKRTRKAILCSIAATAADHSHGGRGHRRAGDE